VKAFRKRFILQVYFDKKYEEYYTLQQGSMSVQSYHPKFVKLLKYVPDDKNHLKVHRFLVGLDSKIKTMVNVLNPKTLKQAYDLVKRAKSNFGITKTLMNYAPDEKDKEPFIKKRGAEQQALHNSNIKIN